MPEISRFLGMVVYSSMPPSPSYDVIIAGAGMAGLTLAYALANQGLKIALVEKKDIRSFQSKEPFDGRASAIAHAPKEALVRLGVWESLAPYASPIEDIVVTDGHSPFILHFNHSETGGVPMGYMVQNHHLLLALLEKVQNHPSITLFSPASYTGVEQFSHKVRLTLEGGGSIEAALLVATDGKYSGIREKLGIKTTCWDYEQTAIVCTIAHEKDHGCLAREHFLPGGPFAVLPLQGGKHSSLVWVEKTPLVPEFLALSGEELLWHIQQRIGDALGKIELVSTCLSYPLTVCFAKEYYKSRVVLLGDAAHTIHPIAGQGFNLGIQDIASLTDAIIHYRQLGMDIGSHAVLARYTEERRPENMAMLMITDSLTRLFSTHCMPVKQVRRLGMGVIDQLPAFKRFFIRYAMGVRTQ